MLKNNVTYHDTKEEVKDELEEEFKQYIDFNEKHKQDFHLPPSSILSPSKVDETNRIF